jgi:hypothetical protein
MMSKPWFPESALLSRNLREAAGAGQPFAADFRFPIADCQLATSHDELEIGNRKLAITYVM